ncbi:MAG: ATP-binding protein [Armatimonadota bacterium]|nr:ATP-binding protein [Armatimonadota bacterium]MDR7569195.1 ATP-binding protein [Armatimonadota bacterium]MDR7613313.1 ATP-binding protein [Armatimonadota bacterium]
MWVFETDWSPQVHQLSDGRYLYRHNDQNLPFPATDIEAIKNARRKLIWEDQIVPEATLADINTDLVKEVVERVGLDLSVEEALLHYHLAEKRNGRLFLRRAALLLFGRDPSRWHPRCGIDFAVWQGTERRTGPEFNIRKRLRIEGIPLVRLVEEAYRTIQPYLPERQTLVDLFFEERLVYPTFAWQEAIVNAIAHRDYALEGIGIEVDLFDDRLEVRSPGEPVPPVTLERLRRREKVHASRNPRIVRVLTDLGYMRERGEGIPRMFEVMEREGLRPPELAMEGGCFVVTLHSTPIYRPETMYWLRRYEGQGLTRNQLRLLAYAYEHGGRFTSRAYQKLVGVDPYTASRDIKDLLRRRIVRLNQPRGRVYEIIPEPEKAPQEKPPELLALEPILHEKGYVKNEDVRRVFGVSRIQAFRLLQHLVEMGFLRKQGKGRGACYVAIQNTSISRGNAIISS